MNSQLEIKLATKMTDTPETDSILNQFEHLLPNWLASEMAAVARKLERERDAAQKAMGDARDILLDAMPDANAPTKILAEMIVAERDKYQDQADALVDRLGATQERMINAEREREEWKAKYIQQNKDLGIEMMDPNGTIWDYAKWVQSELTVVKKQLDQLEGKICFELGGHPDSKLWGDAGLIAATMRCVDALDAVTDQRDRLAEVLLALRNNESFHISGAAYEIVEQALQSLNQPTEP